MVWGELGEKSEKNRGQKQSKKKRGRQEAKEKLSDKGNPRAAGRVRWLGENLEQKKWDGCWAR